MAISRTDTVLQLLRRASLGRDGGGLTDAQLLDSFVRRHDTAALEALVRRHGPMVWGVCHRTLANDQDAEDAFQATFLVLVRRAASIVPREMVANWLYGVAQQTALKARQTTAKRSTREKQVMDMPEPKQVERDDQWDDLRPVLDQELSHLPDVYRAVLILCDLECRTRKEAAEQLGVPEGTVASRLARARVMLSKRLARHGLNVSGGALAAILSGNVASAGVPASVLSATIKTTTLIATGQATAGVISTNVAALTEGVLKAMFITKLKTAGTVLVTACVLAVGLLSTPFSGPGGNEARAAGQEKSAKGGEVTGPGSKPGGGQSDKAGDEMKKGDLAKLQGTWTGEVRSDDAEYTVRLTVEGKDFTEVYRCKDDGREFTGRGQIILDESADPKQMTMKVSSLSNSVGRIPGRIPEEVKAIYQFDDKGLTRRSGRTDRPTEFKPGDPCQVIFTRHEKREDGQKEPPTGGTGPIKGKDADPLAGKWSVLKVQVTGPHAPDEAGVKEVHIAGKKITFGSDQKDRGETMAYSLDPSKNPKEIDLIGNEVRGLAPVYKGIYQVDGDELRIAFTRNQADGAARPATFDVAKRGDRVYTLKRLNPQGDPKETPGDGGKKADRQGKPADLEKRLVGTWVGHTDRHGESYTFRADGTFKQESVVQVRTTQDGTWAFDWDTLPPTLVLKVTKSDTKEAPVDTVFKHKVAGLDDKKLVFAGPARDYPVWGGSQNITYTRAKETPPGEQKPAKEKEKKEAKPMIEVHWTGGMRHANAFYRFTVGGDGAWDFEKSNPAPTGRTTKRGKLSADELNKWIKDIEDGGFYQHKTDVFEGGETSLAVTVGVKDKQVTKAFRPESKLAEAITIKVEEFVRGEATVELTVVEVERLRTGRATRGDESEPLVLVAKAAGPDGDSVHIDVSWEVATRLKRLGIEDPAEHFKGKVVRLRGTAERLTRRPGPASRIEVTNLDQFEVIRKP